ncbi:hypothetical protein [Streptomyces virginiae]|uniref:hypothetical protein n=1 Tax=Streptomyces virginiae TaxID=1961 RepID=UPI002DBD184E|nr:hypothetical protein [Streptomyces sp. CMAA1738]MEC4576518.1 hypothetical protein [Streptomyces sp. CMAA1738]
MTLKNADAPTTQRFDLGLPEGASLVADGAGGYDIVTSAGGAGAAPAVTSTLRGRRTRTARRFPRATASTATPLVQTIKTSSDTAFPVVAGPHYTWGIISGTVYFNKSETKALALGGSMVSWLPHPAAEVGGRTLAGVAGYAVATDQCIKFKVYPGLAPLSPALALSASGVYGGSAGDGYCR